MAEINLKAAPRELLGKKVKILRIKGQIPAILYGRNFKPQPLVLDKKEFTKISAEAGEASLINLEVPGQKPMKVLIRHLQKDPVKDDLIHLDLYKVDMTQEIQTEIPLEFEGLAPAVEELEGNLITNKTTLKVECLPDKLVSKIAVDISVLRTFEDLICVKDLKIPEGIKVQDSSEDVIAQVTPPRSEEELKAMEAETAAEAEKTQIETMEAEAVQEKTGEEPAAKEEQAPGQEKTVTPEEKKEKSKK